MGNRHKHRNKRGGGTARTGHGSPPASSTESDSGALATGGTATTQASAASASPSAGSSASPSVGPASAGSASASRLGSGQGGNRRGAGAAPTGSPNSQAGLRTPAANSVNGSGAAGPAPSGLRGLPVQRNLPNPGVRAKEGRSGGARAKVGPAGQPLQGRAASRPETQRGEPLSPSLGASPIAGPQLQGRNGRQGMGQGMGQGVPRSGRPASVNLPRPRLTPLESLGPFPDTETKPTAADEAADELDGAVGGSHAVAGPNGFQIPPREHTERERLAMRPEIRGELGSLIDELRGIFERDRGAASQSSATRCGICYLHHPPEELEYRESEGFYVCERCSQALRGKRLPMIRRQQR